MTFTDDDLKRLKDYLESNNRIYPGIMGNEMKALLTRLECAEKMISDTDPCSCEAITGRQCIHQKHYEAWRKSKGE